MNPSPNTHPQDFPLGVPINRKEVPEFPPIRDRPNWFVGKDGKPFYVEPLKPTTIIAKDSK